MSSKKIKIFDETGCLSQQALTEYAHGKLGIHLKKQVEIHINECDFCREALEGISLMKNKESARAAITQLNQKISNYGKPEEAVVKVITMNYWRIAAAITIFVVLGGGVLYVAYNPTFNNKMAVANKNEEKDLAENKQLELPKPDEQVTDTLTAAFKSPPPPVTTLNALTLKDETSEEVALENDTKFLPGDGLAATEDKNAEDISGNNFATMTATGGVSNVAPSFYNPQGFIANQSNGVLSDSVFTFDTDRYVTDDANAAMAQETPATLEAVTISRTAKNKSNDKKAQKEADEFAKNENKGKAEAEKRTRAGEGSLAEVNYKDETVSKSVQQAASIDFESLKVADERKEVEQTRRDLELAAETKKPEEQKQNNNAEPYTIVEKMPYYPGGDIAVLKQIRDNINYPQSAREQAISGTVFISFVVTEQGKVTKVKVSKGVSKELDNEAVRVVSLLKDFTPGIQGGKAVPVQMNLPVKFSLE